MINDDGIGRIERLNELKDKGLLSAEEFERAKSEILFGKPRQASTLPQFPAGASLENLPPSLQQAIVPLTKYAEFTGRSDRREFWSFFLLQVIVFALLLGIDIMSTPTAPDPEFYMHQRNVIETFADLALLLLMLGSLVPMLAVQARRFHDQGKSGFLVLINFVPLVGAFIVLIFMALDGQHGPNQYGDDPRET